MVTNLAAKEYDTRLPGRTGDDLSILQPLASVPSCNASFGELYWAYPANNNTSFPKSTAVTHWHGTLHGMAMKDPYEPRYTGGSKNPLMGGFGGLLVGRGEDGKAWDFGRVGNFWSSRSSGNSGNTAYRRAVNYMENRANTVNAQRYRLFSVRCKKDD